LVSENQLSAALPRILPAIADINQNHILISKNC
jgi:hypothetical protein